MEVRVRGIKLVTGEEIVGSVTESELGVVIRNPVSLFPSREGLVMQPWPSLSIDKEVLLKHEFIVLSFTLPDEVVNGYNSKFGGITLVPASALELLK